MIVEILDKNGKVLTTLSVYDDVFRKLEIEAAERGISVEAYIHEVVVNYIHGVLDNEQDKA